MIKNLEKQNKKANRIRKKSPNLHTLKNWCFFSYLFCLPHLEDKNKVYSKRQTSYLLTKRKEKGNQEKGICYIPKLNMHERSNFAKK